MNDIRELIVTIRDFSRELEDRHNAFALLVKRYQDMAFACAYAVLGDFYLAEDCAQEAFITAWQSIHQLRAPEAFAGWLRRIVLTKCNRITRGQRLPIVPLELVTTVASETDPHTIVEQRDVSKMVIKAIQALPRNERIATTMFYVDGYTQTEIGEFLEVPETTVNKRLYFARQHLKNDATFETLRRDLLAHRPSRNEAFADMVAAKLRPFSEEDWTALPKPNADAEDWLHKRRKFDQSRYVRRHYVAEHVEDGRLLGYGSIEQTITLPRYRMILVIEPRAVRSGVAELLVERLLQDLSDVGATTVMFQDFQSSPELTNFLEQKGFTETARVDDLRLTLKTADISLLSSCIQRVTDRGIAISTLARERETDTRYVEKLYRLTSEVRMDDPAGRSFAPPAFYEREARIWLEQSYVLPHGYFIAKHGDEYVGVTDLNLRDALPRGVSFGFTGVKRAFRRQEIARALTLSAISWAQKQKFETIRALTPSNQSPLRILQQDLGFTQLVSYVTLEKCLREVASIDTKLYDDYAGSYQDADRRPDLVFTVRNESGCLTLEFIGQKVRLFPESDRKFFCTPFYGEFTFVTDDDGQVTHLESRDRGLNEPESVFLARRIG